MHTGPNRYVCSVLEEMREQLRALSYYNLHRYKRINKLMIEEAQTMVNRMEEGLDDLQQLRDIRKEIKKAKKELRKLQADIEVKENEKE